MKKLLVLLLCVPLIGLGQVYIPDANFKAYLVGNTAINTNGDSEIQVSEAAAFNGTIDCYNMSINDLTGIEAFTSLTSLYCSYNQLTSLDVSGATALTYFICGSNLLTSLDISNNTALTNLDCHENQITSLDVSSNTALTNLYCSYNQLTSLDVSQNAVLSELSCQDNQLTSLDVSNNTDLMYMDCSGNLLTTLDLSQNDSISYFNFSDNILLECMNLQNGNNCFISDLDTNGNPSLSCIAIDTLPYNGCPQFNSPPIGLFMNTCSNFSCGWNSTIVIENDEVKELLKVIDVLGREVNEKRNTPLFYLYKDGTVEKKIIIE